MEQSENYAFDAWYQELCIILAHNGKCAPYKMAWYEFYEQGLSVQDAANQGPSEIIN